MEGKRCSVMRGDRISWGSGEASSVGSCVWRIRSAMGCVSFDVHTRSGCEIVNGWKDDSKRGLIYFFQA